jgi:hypothetical protein
MELKSERERERELKSERDKEVKDQEREVLREGNRGKKEKDNC